MTERAMSSRVTNFILAVSTLVGTIIGVGMFGLPYAASRSGVAVTLAYLLVLGFVVTIIHLIYGEIVLRTSARHRLVGYAQIYLGRWGKLAASVIFFVTLYLALWVYLLVGGEFLSTALSGYFSAGTGSLILAAVGFFVIYRGVRLAGVFEFLMTLVLLALIAGLVIYSKGFVAKENLILPPASLADWFLPYGIVLFALAGGSAVPEIRSLFRGGQSSVLKKAIVWGTWLPIAVYAVFILVVVGISGGATSTEAIKGLSPFLFLGANVVKYGAAIGFLAVITSFFTIGLNIKNSFRFDLGWSPGVSFILTVAVPLALFWLGWNDFIKIISVGGAVLGGLEGLLLLAIWRRARRRGDRQPEYALKLRPILVCLIALVFLAGIVYEIVYTLR